MSDKGGWRRMGPLNRADRPQRAARFNRGFADVFQSRVVIRPADGIVIGFLPGGKGRVCSSTIGVIGAGVIVAREIAGIVTDVSLECCVRFCGVPKLRGIEGYCALFAFGRLLRGRERMSRRK